MTGIEEAALAALAELVVARLGPPAVGGARTRVLEAVPVRSRPRAG